MSLPDASVRIVAAALRVALVMTGLTTVKSSNIKAVGYDPATRALDVQFNSGATHRYADVPPEKHAAMMGTGAPGHSVGSYFHANIKSAHKSSKVED